MFVYIISHFPFYWAVFSLAALVFVTSNVMKAAWINVGGNPAPAGLFTASVFWVHVTFFTHIISGEPRFWLKTIFIGLSAFMYVMFFKTMRSDPGYIRTSDEAKKKVRGLVWLPNMIVLRIRSFSCTFSNS